MEDSQDYEINYKEIGQRIKMIRSKLKMTQIEFMQAIRTKEKVNDNSTLSKWENGTSDTRISVDKLASIAKLANTTLDWLVFGKGEPPAILSNTKEDVFPYTLQDICRMITALIFYFHAEIDISRTENYDRVATITFHELEIRQVFPVLYNIVQNWEECYKKASKEEKEEYNIIRPYLPWYKYIRPLYMNGKDFLSLVFIDFFEQLSKVIDIEKIGDASDSDIPFCDGFELLLNKDGFELGFQMGATSRLANQLLGDYIARVPSMTMKEFLKDKYLNDEYK